jgi:hypothetical protein
VGASSASDRITANEEMITLAASGFDAGIRYGAPKPLALLSD